VRASAARHVAARENSGGIFWGTCPMPPE